MSRSDFREQCVERDGGQCIVPWCSSAVTVDPDGPGEIHHILERGLWLDGGYIPNNGASVCNDHHRMAEENEIPPQAFWRWIGAEDIPLPSHLTGISKKTVTNVHRQEYDIGYDKWGEPFETPAHSDLRQYPKYPSTRHLLPLYWRSERGTADERTGRDDTGLTTVDSFLDIPLVCTVKMDGSNTMLVADKNEPVRARNGREADHESFDQLKQEYWNRNVYENLPEHLQVFGENMYAKHSIHYGCDGCCDQRNQGPAVDDIFLIFGVYDTRYDLWLSWQETEKVAEQIDFPTVPTIHGHNDDESQVFLDENQFVHDYTSLAEETVSWGNEGIVVRSMYPFHYGQFERKVGKYVRPNHVQTDEHWSHQQTTGNVIESTK